MRIRIGTLLAAGAVCFSAVDTAAQTTLGVRGGLNLSTLSGDEVGDVSSRTGLRIGGTALFQFGGNVGIQVGGEYSQRGATVDIDGIEAALNVDYIEVPVLLRLAVPTQGAISPHFGVGPVASFEIGCDLEGSFEGTTVSASCEEAELATTSIDFGIMGNAGVDIATSGGMSWTFDVLYNYGLTSLDDSEDPADVKSRAWSFLVGAGFPLG